MQVQAAESRYRENLRGQQPSVCCNDDDFRAVGLQLRHDFCIPERSRLHHRDAEFLPSLLDGRRFIGLASAASAVRRSINCRHLNFRVVLEGIQHRNHKARRTHEHRAMRSGAGFTNRGFGFRMA